jgi:hypothetical protein
MYSHILSQLRINRYLKIRTYQPQPRLFLSLTTSYRRQAPLNHAPHRCENNLPARLPQSINSLLSKQHFLGPPNEVSLLQCSSAQKVSGRYRTEATSQPFISRPCPSYYVVLPQRLGKGFRTGSYDAAGSRRHSASPR